MVSTNRTVLLVEHAFVFVVICWLTMKRFELPVNEAGGQAELVVPTCQWLDEYSMEHSRE